MVVGTRQKSREYEYLALAGRKQVTIVAHNINEASSKAKRLFPKAKLISVSRKSSSRGREYETYWISR